MEVNNPGWVAEFLNASRFHPTDQDKVRLAVALARENVLRGTGGPFGAAVFAEPTGALVSAGVNGVVRLGTGTAHAEVVAIMLAHGAVGCHTLRGAEGGPFTLASSCEPCAMCLGAVLWSGVDRLICGAVREDASALGLRRGPRVRSILRPPGKPWGGRGPWAPAQGGPGVLEPLQGARRTHLQRVRRLVPAAHGRFSAAC